MKNEEACRRLWLSVISSHYESAINNFKLPSANNKIKSFEQQKLKFGEMIEKDPSNFFRLFKLPNTDCNKSRCFFETSQFDEIASLVGYDSLFVNKIFESIQKTITYEKELMNMFFEKSNNNFRLQ